MNAGFYLNRRLFQNLRQEDYGNTVKIMRNVWIWNIFLLKRCDRLYRRNCCEVWGNMIHTFGVSGRIDNNANTWDEEGFPRVNLSRSRLRENENRWFCFGTVSFYVSIKWRVEILNKQWSIGAWSPGVLWSRNWNISSIWLIFLGRSSWEKD